LFKHYVIKFASDLSQVGGLLRGPPVCPTTKPARHDIAEILLKVALSTIKPTKHFLINFLFYKQAYEEAAKQW
jgi:hypothetical protein